MPVFSVDTKEEAKDLQLLLCRRMYDGRLVMNNWPGDTYESLAWATKQLSEWHDYLQKRRKI